MFDHRSKDKVMSWVNGVNRMLQVGEVRTWCA